MSPFGERLCAAMSAEEIGTNRLAELCDTHPPNISAIRYDRVQPTVPLVALMLAAMPNVNARWLVTGKAGWVESGFADQAEKAA